MLKAIGWWAGGWCAVTQLFGVRPAVRDHQQRGGEQHRQLSLNIGEASHGTPGNTGLEACHHICNLVPACKSGDEK